MKRTPLKRKSKTPLAKAKDKLWELCKELTRKRYGYNCYTCGTYAKHPHTGHFITSSTCSTELRYDLSNLRPQCYACNVYRSGNWIEFEKRLIDEGVDVEELKKRNERTKGLQYDISWYEEKTEEYEKLLENDDEVRYVVE